MEQSRVIWRSEGLLLLKLHEVKHLTQSAIHDTVSVYQWIFEHALLEVNSQIQESLLLDCVDSGIVAKALSSYDNPKSFSGLETAYLQWKYYQQEFGMLVRSYKIITFTTQWLFWNAEHCFHLLWYYAGTMRSGAESRYILYPPIRRKNPQSEMSKIISAHFNCSNPRTPLTWSQCQCCPWSP